MHITNIDNRPDWYHAIHKDKNGYTHHAFASTRAKALSDCLASIYQSYKWCSDCNTYHHIKDDICINEIPF